ncbi:hypothetical protein ABZ914_38980 [Spirillospora sp. NPDC046719]
MRKFLSALVLTVAALLAGFVGLSTGASASTASAAAPAAIAGGCHHCCGDHNTNVNINING